jgi:DNA-binding phage protein
MARSKKHQEFLFEHLADHDEAVAYLNAALEESLKGDEESQQLCLVALRNFVKTKSTKIQKKIYIHVKNM